MERWCQNFTFHLLADRSRSGSRDLSSQGLHTRSLNEWQVKSHHTHLQPNWLGNRTLPFAGLLYIFSSVISKFWAVLCYLHLHKACGVILEILKIISVHEIEKEYEKGNMKRKIYNVEKVGLLSLIVFYRKHRIQLLVYDNLQ